MSILSKLMDTMRFSPDEDEEYFGPDEYGRNPHRDRTAYH